MTRPIDHLVLEQEIETKGICYVLYRLNLMKNYYKVTMYSNRNKKICLHPYTIHTIVSRAQPKEILNPINCEVKKLGDDSFEIRNHPLSPHTFMEKVTKENIHLKSKYTNKMDLLKIIKCIHPYPRQIEFLLFLFSFRLMQRIFARFFLP